MSRPRPRAKTEAVYLETEAEAQGTCPILLTDCLSLTPNNDNLIRYNCSVDYLFRLIHNLYECEVAQLKIDIFAR